MYFKCTSGHFRNWFHRKDSPNLLRVVICHNDVHQGNVMRNKDGELQLDSIILVDFDQAGYGFRVWIIMYFLSNLGEMPSDEIINESLQGKNHPAN